MEVKNTMVDQMLVNTAAQVSANPKVKPEENAERPDFDSMMHQKRSKSETTETKPEKANGQDLSERAEKAEEGSAAEEPYAIAAAMMYQAMPNTRIMAVQTEESVPQQVEAISVPVELPGASVAARTEKQVSLPEEAVALVEQQAAQPKAEPDTQQRTENVISEPAQETPVAAKHETPVQAARTVEDEPKTDRNETQPERAVVGPETTRSETRPDTQRAVKPEAPAAEQSEEDNAETAQTAQETPLFERVEAPVIKVAEVSHPVPLEAENGIEQLGSEVGNIVVNSADANRIEVTLAPENLGKLTVEVTRGTDGTLNVVLHATTERTANLLEKGVDGLRQALAASAERNVQIQVRGNEETQQQFLNPDDQSDQNRQQQQRQNRRRNEQQNAQDFMQQLRLGLVDVGE